MVVSFAMLRWISYVVILELNDTKLVLTPHSKIGWQREWIRLYSWQDKMYVGRIIMIEKSFWAEAVCTAVYLINRSSNASLMIKIPEELWRCFKVDNSHLRQFRCLAYVNITHYKMSHRVVKEIFLRYHQGVKGYRVDTGKWQVL